jgi:hypothetical protein
VRNWLSAVEDGGASHGRFCGISALIDKMPRSRDTRHVHLLSQKSRGISPVSNLVFRDVLLVSPSLAFSRSARFPWFLVTEFCHQLSLLFLFMSPVSCFWMLNHARLLPWILRDKGLFPAGSASAVIDR